MSAQPGVRLRTLMLIRWVALIGQLSALAVVDFALNLPLPWLPCLVTTGLLASFNLILHATMPRNRHLRGSEAAVHLLFDLLQLTGLLFLTGGTLNPFVILIVVPVTISATLLSLRSTLTLGVLATGGIILLTFWAQPLPWTDGPLAIPTLYRAGLSLALVLCMALLAAYAWRLSSEGRRRQRALVATQAALAREQTLSELGALAAAAAHDLGGPLGTIKLIANDLVSQLGNDPDFGADVHLLLDESRRSGDLLQNLARRTHAKSPIVWVSLETVMREVAARHEQAGVTLGFEVDAASSSRQIERTPEILHALGNLVANAVRHAHKVVSISVKVEPAHMVLTVTDDGSGFPEDLLPLLGEPFLGRASGVAPRGLGLGIFIAVTLLGRTGATVTFGNASRGGAQVIVCWPLGVFRLAQGTIEQGE